MYTPAAMQCPSCHAEVPDDVAVCPQCDAVVDPSLFDVEPGPSSAKPKSGKSGGRRVIRKGGSARKKKISPQMRAQTLNDAAPPDEDPDPEPTDADADAPADWRSKLSPEDWEPQAAAAPEISMDERLGRRSKAAEKASLDDEFISDAKTFMNGLSGSDKVAFFGGAGMIVSCFFPYRETVVDGEVLGLISQGALIFVLGIVGMTLIAVRTRGLLPKVNPLFIWAAQLGAMSFSILWALVCIKLSWDSTLARATVGNEEIWVSKPGFGAFFGLASASLATMGTALGLKDISLR